MAAPQTDDVLAAIRRHPDGVTLAQLEQELSPQPQRRLLQYALGLLEEQRQIVNVGTTRNPQYRVAGVTPGGSVVVAPATPAVQSPVAEQRLGATAMGVDREQVKELVDLIIAARVPSVAVKPYIRQAARGLANADDFVAAALAELNRRNGAER